MERIASRVGERTTVLDVNRVSHFISKDKLTFAVLNGREHVVDCTLSELESRLDVRRFARIHRSTLVNISLVHELFPAVDGGVLVRLKDDTKTELSVTPTANAVPKLAGACECPWPCPCAWPCAGW